MLCVHLRAKFAYGGLKKNKEWHLPPTSLELCTDVHLTKCKFQSRPKFIKLFEWVKYLTIIVENSLS